MIRWSWAAWPVQVGAEHAGATWPTRKATLVDVRHRGQAEYWLLRVLVVSGRSTIARAEHKQLHARQLPLGLVTRTCSCGSEWDPPMSGRVSALCPNCRYDRRREYFAARRRALNAAEAAPPSRGETDAQAG